MYYVKTVESIIAKQIEEIAEKYGIKKINIGCEIITNITLSIPSRKTPSESTPLILTGMPVPITFMQFIKELKTKGLVLSKFGTDIVNNKFEFSGVLEINE